MRQLLLIAWDRYVGGRFAPVDKFDKTRKRSLLSGVNRYSDRFIRRIKLVSPSRPGVRIDIGSSVTSNLAEICAALLMLLSVRPLGILILGLRYRRYINPVNSPSSNLIGENVDILSTCVDLVDGSTR